MSTRFDRLTGGFPITEPSGNATLAFTQYWQRLLEQVEAALVNLEAAQEDIEAILDTITQILIDVGIAQLTADGALELAESAINPDGTVKTGKVTTDSVAAEAITRPTFHSFADVVIPDTGSDTTIGTTSTETVGDAIYGGADITMQFVFANSVDGDSGAEIYLETNSNGAGWVRHADATVKVGARTDSGTTFAFIPVTSTYPVAASGLTTLAARMVGASIMMPGATALWESEIINPSIRLIPMQR